VRKERGGDGRDPRESPHVWSLSKVDQGFVALWLARHLYDGRLTYIGYGGSGKQVRDVLHGDDLCELVALEIARLDDVNGQIFNVGGGRSVSASLLELTALCRRATGTSIPIDAVTTNRQADVPLYITDTAKLHGVLGWSPARGVERIVADTRGRLDVQGRRARGTGGK
jgi:CDP-paratose 2-epimerase